MKDKMTEQEIRIEKAKAAGWKSIRTASDSERRSFLVWVPPGMIVHEEELPVYPTDSEAGKGEGL